MAPSSKAIRTGWQTMPSPLLRYTPIRFPTDTDRWVLDRHMRTSPLLCPIQAVWRKNKGKRRQKTTLDFAEPASQDRNVTRTDKTQRKGGSTCAGYKTARRLELCPVWEKKWGKETWRHG